jgi:uncharacterized protein involved in exopolysaccharide biosynthesis/Mrp family chromosome partitioning ATPase
MLMPSTYSISGQDSAHMSNGRPGLLAVLVRGRRKVVTTTALSVALAALYLALAAPTYTSRSRLYIDPTSNQFAGEAAPAPASRGAALAIVDSQVAIISSDAILRSVVEMLSLDRDTEFAYAGPLSALQTSIIGRSEPDRAALATERLARQIRVLRRENTYILDVEITSVSPAKAAQINDTVVSLYLADQANARADDERRANELINSRLGELRDQAQQAEMRVDDFKKRNRILVANDRLFDEQQFANLNDELVTARATTAGARGRLDAARSTLTSEAELETMPEAVRSPTIQRLREQDTEAARREASLAAQLRGRHPALIEARSQRNEIQSQIEAELRRIVSALASDHDIATSRELELQRLIEASKTEVSRVSTAQIKLRELEQEVATSREVLGTFLQRAKEAREQEKITVPYARIVSAAMTPFQSSWPDTWLVLALGLFGGASLGAARAFADDRLDTTVRPPSGATTLSQHILFPVPAFRRKTRSQLSSSRRSLAIRKRPGGAELGRILDAIAAPDGADEALYRQSILHLLGTFEQDRHVGYPSAIMVLGADAHAGTSSVGLALAHSSALRGERVLLVDACSSDAMLSRALAPEQAEGWATLLAKPEALTAHTVGGESLGFALLPLARADLGLLKRDERRQLAANLAAASLDYDLVIIDGGVITLDESASALLPLTDKILVVARNGMTQKAQFDDVLRILAPQRSKVAGVVLTGTVSGS